MRGEKSGRRGRRKEGERGRRNARRRCAQWGERSENWEFRVRSKKEERAGEGKKGVEKEEGKKEGKEGGRRRKRETQAGAGS